MKIEDGFYFVGHTYFIVVPAMNHYCGSWLHTFKVESRMSVITMMLTTIQVICLSAQEHAEVLTDSKLKLWFQFLSLPLCYCSRFHLNHNLGWFIPRCAFSPTSAAHSKHASWCSVPLFQLFLTRCRFAIVQNGFPLAFLKWHGFIAEKYTVIHLKHCVMGEA